MKYLTFSYDDGVTQDKRLVKLFNKYGMKATFNINSGLFGRENRLTREGVEINRTTIMPEEVNELYKGHEVAAHTLTHPLLPSIEDEKEVIRQVEEDRLALSALVGYEVVGFAYPCGGTNHNKRIADIIRANTGVRYCRTIDRSHSLTAHPDLYEFNPTLHHFDFDEMYRLGEELLSYTGEDKRVLYIWGHSYEFDIDNSWGKFEDFLKFMSGRDGIIYATNKEALL